MSGNVPSLQEAFSEINDFRNAQGKRYKLQAILVLTCLAMMHGAQSKEAIAEWSGNEGQRWLKLLGIRRRRGPSQATLQRIFKGIDRHQLETVISRWSREILAAGVDSTGERETISLRGASERGLADREAVDSLGALNEWMGLIMNHLPAIDLDVDDGKRDSLFESLALHGCPGTDFQHVSQAGLKIWGVDYESLNSKRNGSQLEGGR